MKSAIQYVSDKNGNMQAVQLPLVEWQKLMAKLKKYEQILKLKSDLKDAFSEVEKMQKGHLKKQTLSDFLHEL
jgi:hypothetical protein